MANNITGIVEPTVLVTLGPTYATDVNASITAIDNHDHTTNNGLSVPFGGGSPGVAIVGDQNMGSFSLNNLASTQYTSLGGAGTTPSFTSGLYTKTISTTNELFWVDSAGLQVQITTGGGLGPSGVPANNGFNGDYVSASASALYNLSGLAYEFYQNSGSTLASGLFNTLYLQPTSSGLNLYMATSGEETPVGGWALGNSSNRFDLAFDNSADDYATTAFSVKNTGAGLKQYFFGLNASTSPLYPIDQRLLQTGHTVAVTAARLSVSSSTGGAVGVGFGPQVLLAANANSSDATPLSQAAIEGFWNTSGAHSGIRIRGGNAGTLTTTAGIEIFNNGTEDILGIGGAAVNGNKVTIYGNTAPATNDTYTLGGGSLVWSNVYSRIFSSDAGMTITAATSTINITPATSSGTKAVFVTGDVRPNGSYFLGNSGSEWTALYINSTAFTTTSSNSSAFLGNPSFTPVAANTIELTARHRENNVVLLANVAVSGSTPTLTSKSWNVNTTTFPVVRTGAGAYTVTPIIPISTTAVVTATLQGFPGVLSSISVVNNGTSINVQIVVSGSGFTDFSFAVTATGAPQNTP